MGISIKTYQLLLTSCILVAFGAVAAFSTLISYEVMTLQRDTRPLTPAVEEALEGYPVSYAYGVGHGDDGAGPDHNASRTAWCMQREEWWMHAGRARYAPGEAGDLGARLAFDEGCRQGWDSLAHTGRKR